MGGTCGCETIATPVGGGGGGGGVEHHTQVEIEKLYPSQIIQDAMNRIIEVCNTNWKDGTCRPPYIVSPLLTNTPNSGHLLYSGESAMYQALFPLIICD